MVRLRVAKVRQLSCTMINQQALESLFLATYLEDYFDSCENLPDDVQKQATRMRELDVEYQKFLKDVEHQLTVLLDCPDVPNPGVSKLKIQHALMSAQDKGDEKLQITQQIQDYMDNKVRQLDLDLKNLGYTRDQENDSRVDSKAMEVSEKPVKRARRARHEVYVPSILGPSTLEATSFSENLSAVVDNHQHSRNSSSHAASHAHSTASTENVKASIASMATGGGSSQSSHGEATGNSSKNTSLTDEKLASSSGSGVVNAGSSSSTTTPKKQSQHKKDTNEKKYKKRKKQLENSPPSIPIDPDEPTYCLCDQVSYGEMIGCDNDLCPIEWFHFSCVQLNSSYKPKGKWYCPKCRGDRPNVMKPKAIFLKELEKYNREKEEKS
ncbi:unnamed protein product [Allacma fusca]|uniref:Inhibitor of growth protein n=1 Tax=Allacma fusca TaxID=39272 RepID=A0A8J2NHA1_9HEXA|nr:unnamed protein product [Allacma fusca]